MQHTLEKIGNMYYIIDSNDFVRAFADDYNKALDLLLICNLIF